jgi:dihydroorotase
MSSILFKSVTVVCSEERKVCDVFCEGGKILKMGEGLDIQADSYVYGKGLYLFPGIIDPHVHFRDPGLTHKEDFHTGSMAAVAGGVTTVIDMPNTNPPTYDLVGLDVKRMIAAKKSVCNYGFYMGAVGSNNDEIDKAKNIAGVKVVMNVTPAGAQMDDPELLEQVFSLEGRRFTLHAEGETFDLALGEYLLKKENPVIHLAHISLRREVERVRELKRNGVNVTCEVAPHHLFMSEFDFEQHGAYCSMKPPLATLDDQTALWEGIEDGTIDMIATDHAPHTRAEKEDSKEGVTNGVPGVQTSLPLMLNAVFNNRLSLEKLVDLMCERPAEVFGLKGKGKIAEGMDADLVLIDMEFQVVLSGNDQQSKCGWTPYDGWLTNGTPVMTLVGGEVAFERGKVYENVRGREVRFLV